MRLNEQANRMTTNVYSAKCSFAGKFIISVCSPQGRVDTATHPKSSSNSITQKIRKQSTITSYFRKTDTGTSNTGSATGTHSTVQPKPNFISDYNFIDKQRLPIYYNNVRSIVNKRNVCTKIELSPFKVLCFTETFLDGTVNFNFPDSFHVHRCDRVSGTVNSRTRRSGGVAVLVHKTLKSKLIELQTDPQCEFIAVEISLKPQSLIIYVCYMSEFELNIASKHFERIKELTEKYPNHRIMVVGDFNLYQIEWEEDESGDYYLPKLSATNQSDYFANAHDFLLRMLSLPLFQLSNVINSVGNVLDLLFVSDSTDVNLRPEPNTIIEADQQDEFHRPYDISIDYCSKGSTGNHENTTTVFCYRRGNYERLCQQLDSIDFAHEINSRTTDLAYDFFHRTINSLIVANVPQMTIKKYANKPKWWNKVLQQKKNRCDKLYKRMPKGTVSNEYIAATIEFNTLNERYEKAYIQRIESNIKNDPAAFWKFAKMNNKTSTYPSKMHRGNITADTPNDIVELFANQFESSYVVDNEEWSLNDIERPMQFETEINVTIDDIEMAIRSLKWKSGAGPDGLSPFIVKKCIDSMLWPIWMLYQKTFDHGCIPTELKLSRVVPVFKKGDKKDVSNYRVVAISPVVLKVFEIAVKNRLMIIVEPKICNAQHGFRPKRSVTTNLLNLSVAVNDAFDRGNQVDILYGDFKDAFNVLSHRILVTKMASFGLGLKSITWLCEFVSNRMSFVKIGDIRSRQYRMTSGVPAGSTLGPILFAMFINDLPDIIVHAKMLLFADDSKMFLEISNVDDTERLQADINNMMRWCDENKLPLNLNKCNIFTASRADWPIQVNYSMGGHFIEKKETIRDLGVELDRRFSFGDHIEQTTTKCRQLIGCIKRHSNGKLSKNTQQQLYLAYVRSRLEFASIIWNPHQELYISDIESIQKRFVIYLLENRNGTYLDRCKMLKLQPLELRRKIADAIFAFDLFKENVTDVNINSQFVLNDHFYEFRRARLVNEPFYRTEYLKNQPIARMKKCINQYNEIFRDTVDKNVFRRKIEAKITGFEMTNENN